MIVPVVVDGVQFWRLNKTEDPLLSSLFAGQPMHPDRPLQKTDVMEKIRQAIFAKRKELEKSSETHTADSRLDELGFGSEGEGAEETGRKHRVSVGGVLSKTITIEVPKVFGSQETRPMLVVNDAKKLHVELCQANAQWLFDYINEQMEAAPVENAFKRAKKR